ncbi:MAG: TIGR04086 family membrane protein [Bacilli bacterium]|nr:TIGR04086 family membrane protein [Bacilli bacterium]MDD4733728.1 TIGR04086 family membrane protein [Bacilli bacterium]
MKNILKSLFISFIIILFLTFIVTLLNYTNLFSYKIVNISKIIIPIISVFITSFTLGKKSISKGYLEGIKFSVIFNLILVIYNYLISKNSFELIDLMYFTFIIVFSILGSVIGINRKKDAE